MLSIEDCLVFTARVSRESCETTKPLAAELLTRKSCRAIRIVGDSTRFLFINTHRSLTGAELRIFIEKLAHDGIEIKNESDDNHPYRFLGYTESGLKSGQFILFQEDEHWTCQKLLDTLGDIKQVFIDHGPGKYAARLGLSFSSTSDSLDVPRDSTLEIADWSARDGSLTSDGCGMIRETQAKAIRLSLGLQATTTVFHIRKGGIKGLLVSYPDDIFESICKAICGRMAKYNFDLQYEDLSQYVLAFRDSMFKYDNGPNVLEINGVSQSPTSARLNYSFIILLLTLGVPIEPFKERLLIQLRSIETISLDRETAMKYINGDLDAQGEGFFQDVFEMLYAGYNMDEPYLQERLKAYQRMQYDQLRKKLAIKIQKSCYVYGVVDELGLLKEDEVYLNLPDRDGVCVSKVLVARNPSYFSSDIRVLTAIDRPELSFLTNCIVFSRKCFHSIPDSMAGGDLDGDIYFVCWDQPIIPHRTVMHEDRTSQADSVGRIRRDPEDLTQSLIDYFVRLQGSPLLGVMSNEWTRVVEDSTMLADASYPRRLGELIERLLDSSKTGADVESIKKEYLNSKDQYSANFNVQPGDRPLDGLRELIPGLAQGGPQKLTSLRPDKDLDLRAGHQDEFIRYFDEGKAIMRTFNFDLSKAIKKDELEPNVDGLSIKMNPRERIEKHADKVKREYTERYFPRSSLVGKQINECYLRASAWYHAGYAEGKTVFSWLGARYLHHIKAAATNGGRPGLVVGALQLGSQRRSPPRSYLKSFSGLALH